MGLCIFLFSLKDIKERISKVDSDEIKAGLMGGTFGNKGAVSIRLCVDDSTFCFFNCHLNAGQKSTSERL